jgi:deazaflavin-dependent oxidoreductase (nitroreductase family)
MDLFHTAELTRRLLARKSLLRLVLALHVFVFRISGGRLAGRLANLPILLLTTRGRKTGRRRTVPLCYLPVPSPQGRDPLYAVVASFGGSAVAPDWYKNLQATPVAEVEIRSQRFSVLASDADEPVRARLWQDFVECYPGYEIYQAATSRKIPIVLLELY